METVGVVFSFIVLAILTAVMCVLITVIAAVICMTMWALVKPRISSAIDAWMDWFDRRTSC